MKKILFILLFVLGVSYTLQAKVVTTTEAEKAAMTVLHAKDPSFAGLFSSITPVSNNGIICYYIVNFSPGGWALISADDQAAPLIGYSPKGSFNQSNMTATVKKWMSFYSAEIKEIINENKGVRHKGWTTLAIASRASADVVTPLISINWNQPSPYNKYCPSNSKGIALVGCVAVAMGQAISVCQYPDRPKGNHGYNSANFGTIYVDYDKEAAYNWSDIMNGANNKNEVARLLYHCGVSVNMDYGIDGSGAWTENVPNALQTYFSYPGSVTYYARSSYSGDFSALILNELKGGRAVVFGANNEAATEGHAFNLDGYDGSLFHVNWGWGGSLNGYFSIDALGNSQTDMWTKYQGVVVGIARPGNGPYDITLDGNYVSESQPVGTKVGNITVKSTASGSSYNYTIIGPYSPISHQNIDAPFEVKEGALVTKSVLIKSDTEQWDITISATDINSNLSTSKNFSIYVVDASDLESPAKNVVLVYDKSAKALTISSIKDVSFTLSTSDNFSVSGNVTKNAPVSISLKGITSKTATLKLSNVVLSKTINILLNK